MISKSEFVQLINIYDKASLERKLVPSLEETFLDIFSMYLNSLGISILKEFLSKRTITIVCYDLLGYNVIEVDNSSKLYDYLNIKQAING